MKPKYWEDWNIPNASFLVRDEESFEWTVYSACREEDLYGCDSPRLKDKNLIVIRNFVKL